MEKERIPLRYKFGDIDCELATKDYAEATGTGRKLLRTGYNVQNSLDVLRISTTCSTIKKILREHDVF